MQTITRHFAGVRHRLTPSEIEELRLRVPPLGQPWPATSSWSSEADAREAYLDNRDLVEASGNVVAGKRSEAYWRWIAKALPLFEPADFDTHDEYLAAASELEAERQDWLARADELSPTEVEILLAEPDR